MRITDLFVIPAQRGKQASREAAARKAGIQCLYIAGSPPARDKQNLGERLLLA